MENILKKKLQGITAYELLMLLVQCARNPVIPLDLEKHASVDSQGNITGNLGTNMLAVLSGVQLNSQNIKQRDVAFGIEWELLRKLDHALQSLSFSLFDQYNRQAKKCYLPQVYFDEDLYMEALYNGFTDEQVKAFEELSHYQIRACRCAPRQFG